MGGRWCCAPSRTLCRRLPSASAPLRRRARCTAVGAVLGWCERLRSAESQRLKLATEAGGGLGVLLRPAGALTGPSFADLRLRVAPVAGAQVVRRVRVDVVRWRGGRTGPS